LVGVLPQTSLGQLTAIPRPLAGLKGPLRGEGKLSEKENRSREGRRRGRKERGENNTN